VVGYDLDRRAERCFRLSRVVGEVRATGQPGAYEAPRDLDLIKYVAHRSGPVERPGRATVLVRPGRGAGIRRWAEETAPDPTGRGDRVVLRYADPDSFASWLVGYGADVVVLDPPEVRAAAVTRLREIAAIHARAADLGPAPGPPVPTPPAPARPRAEVG
jgi:proteasome accessory factor B